MIDWFYSSNVSNVQATTEAYWSNWLGSGVTVNLPGAQYNSLFNRSLLVTALHIDAKTGAILAGCITARIRSFGHAMACMPP